ncbi:uncharacterized protein A4U43_C08F6380 [Asparagus officinalis]|nr:uncharacterized protein A4U43_C08F6380 [Asparagus officinalis]
MNLIFHIFFPSSSTIAFTQLYLHNNLQGWITQQYHVQDSLTDGYFVDSQLFPYNGIPQEPPPPQIPVSKSNKHSDSTHIGFSFQSQRYSLFHKTTSSLLMRMTALVATAQALI